MSVDRDPYAALGVPRDATAEQIAQARRRLSRELHPDVNSSPDAAARFDQVQQAFDLLSDPVARAEYDHGTSVRPAAVDFGVLRPGRAKAYAEVTATWTGKRPAVIRTGIVGASWIQLVHERQAGSSVVFSLCAQARPGGLSGRQHGQFTVTLDQDWFSVPLMAELPATDPAAPGRQAPDSLPGWVIPVLVLGLALITAVVWPNAHWYRWAAPSAPASASPTPATTVSAPALAVPPGPVTVQQTVYGASGAAVVQPVFTVSSSAADRAQGRRDGLAWPPVQRGPELLVPLSGAGPGRLCVVVTVPGAGGTSGRTVTEGTLATVTGPGGRALAFAAVLPGRYQLDPSCAPAAADSLATLGTAGPAGVGVTGAGPAGTLVVYATLDTGSSTTISYVAVGPPGSSAPSTQACVARVTGTGQAVSWQPTGSTVSQRVSGSGGWLETGTLVFGLPPGRPDYFTGDCDDVVSAADAGGELGVALP